MSTSSVVQDKVLRYAREVYNIVQIDSDGDVLIPFPERNVYISIDEVIPTESSAIAYAEKHQLPTTWVHVFSILVREIVPSPALYEWIATEGQEFDYGSCKVVKREDGTVEAHLYYNLPGDFIDPGELKNAIRYVGEVTFGIEDTIHEKFGGKRSVDYKESEE